MTKSVDVLAVMDEVVGELESAASYAGEGWYWDNGKDDALLSSAAEARAAVAELIEAAMVVEVADRDGWLDDEIVQRMRLAISRMRGGE